MNKEELSNPVELFARIYKSASVPVAVLDSNLMVEWANEAALKAHPSLSQGDGLFLLLPAPFSKDLLTRLKTGFGEQPVEIPLPLSNCRLSLHAIDPDDPTTGYLLHSLDDKAPGGSALHPEGAERLISVFSSQFRAPISSISSSLSVLRANPLMEEHPELEEVLFNINQNCYQMLRGSINLTEYVRQQSMEVVLKRSMVDFKELLSQLCDAARIVTGHIGIPLSCELPDESILLSCDQNRMVQAILQLIANSCRFTREGNEITVSLRQTDDSVVVSVRDRGVGIPSQVQEMVFDPYFSYDPDGAPFAGMGLGLTVFKYTITLHGGTVGLSSDAEGTTVFFTLPKKQEENLALSSPASVTDFLYDRFSPVYIQLCDSCPPPKP